MTDPQPKPSQEDAAQLAADLEIANKQIEELTETAKRALADLQNYRRKVEEQQSDFVQFATAALLLELLPVLDNFNRAFTQVPEEIQSSAWFKGALQIEQQLISIIKKQGVAEISPTIGQKVDPVFHEAIALGPGEKDVITGEFEKGYMLGKRVLRPAKVKVGDGTEKT